MQWNRKQVVGGVIGVVALAAVLYGGWIVAANVIDPYRGLNKTMVIELDDATRATIENRLATSYASLEAMKKSGEEIDLDLYMSIAGDALYLGDLVTARDYYQKVIDGNPINPVAWSNFAFVAEQMNDDEAAEDAHQQAIINGDMEKYYSDYIDFIERTSTDRDDDIKALLEESVSRMGQSPWSMVRLAQWYEGHGDCDRAEAHYKVAMTLDPENTSIAKDYEEVRTECK